MSRVPPPARGADGGQIAGDRRFPDATFLIEDDSAHDTSPVLEMD
jgi:hypothetical protein